MNETMVPKRLVTLLLVSEVLSSLFTIGNPLPNQKDRIVALAAARAEMSTTTSGLRISQTINSKLPSATHFFFEPADDARVYKREGNE